MLRRMVKGYMIFENQDYDELRKSFLCSIPKGLNILFFKNMNVDFQTMDGPGIYIFGQTDIESASEFVKSILEIADINGEPKVDVTIYNADSDTDVNPISTGYYYGILLVPTVGKSMIEEALKSFKPQYLTNGELMKDGKTKALFEMILNEEVEIEEIFLKLRKLSKDFGPIYHAKLED